MRGLYPALTLCTLPASRWRPLSNFTKAAWTRLVDHLIENSIPVANHAEKSANYCACLHSFILGYFGAGRGRNFHALLFCTRCRNNYLAQLVVYIQLHSKLIVRAGSSHNYGVLNLKLGFAEGAKHIDLYFTSLVSYLNLGPPVILLSWIQIHSYIRTLTDPGHSSLHVNSLCGLGTL